MNLKEKIETEQQEQPVIFLYMEGMFWKAYEQSAMRFAKEVKAYKLQKRFVKAVNGEVVSMIYDNLPVYKATYDLLLTVYRLNRNFQRDYRYTLGENVKNELVALLVCIYHANSTLQKTEHLVKAREHVVVVKLQIRLLMDLKQISLKQYAAAAEQIESVSKQLAAWHKSSERNK